MCVLIGDLLRDAQNASPISGKRGYYSGKRLIRMLYLWVLQVDGGRCCESEGDPPTDSLVVRILWGLVFHLMTNDLGAIEGAICLLSAVLLPVQLC